MKLPDLVAMLIDSKRYDTTEVCLIVPSLRVFSKPTMGLLQERKVRVVGADDNANEPVKIYKGDFVPDYYRMSGIEFQMLHFYNVPLRHAAIGYMYTRLRGAKQLNMRMYYGPKYEEDGII